MAFPAVAMTLVGAPGGVGAGGVGGVGAGVIGFETELYGPGATLDESAMCASLMARTLKMYGVPLVRPVTVYDVDADPVLSSVQVDPESSEY